MAIRARLAEWARRAKEEMRVLRAIARHPRTPRAAKWLAAGLAAYALSPIDLIPDFIPVLGHLDEAILLPLGIVLLYRLTPRAVVEECRARVSQAAS
jgi:uncharacterized membrane protein YkvA (DUF1232 family)